MSTHRRRCTWRAAMVIVAAGAVLSLCSVSPAAADDGGVPLQLVTEPAGTMHLLAPGESAVWPVMVTTNVTSLESLTVQLTARGPLAELSKSSGARKAVSVEVQSCRTPWQGARCASGPKLLLAPTLLGELTGSAIDVGDTPPVARDAYVVVRATLNETAGTEMQGLSAQLRLTATAAGEQSGEAVPSSSGTLAKTGAGLFPFAALAALSVIAGLAVAAGARWRRDAKDRDA